MEEKVKVVSAKMLSKQLSKFLLARFKKRSLLLICYMIIIWKPAAIVKADKDTSLQRRNP